MRNVRTTSNAREISNIITTSLSHCISLRVYNDIVLLLQQKIVRIDENSKYSAMKGHTVEDETQSATGMSH